MVKKIKFYDYKKGKPVMLDNYIVRNTMTDKGLRRQAVGTTKDGRKLYKYVAKDFKK